jgi:hypothetical protein
MPLFSKRITRQNSPAFLDFVIETTTMQSCIVTLLRELVEFEILVSAQDIPHGTRVSNSTEHPRIATSYRLQPPVLDEQFTACLINEAETTLSSSSCLLQTPFNRPSDFETFGFPTGTIKTQRRSGFRMFQDDTGALFFRSRHAKGGPLHQSSCDA